MCVKKSDDLRRICEAKSEDRVERVRRSRSSWKTTMFRVSAGDAFVMT